MRARMKGARRLEREQALAAALETPEGQAIFSEAYKELVSEFGPEIIDQLGQLVGEE